MKYQVQENCLTIFLPNEIDHHNAEELKRESDHLIERNHIRYVIFDFQDTDFMDSSGIGVIMVLSASYATAMSEGHGDGAIHYFLRQAIFAGVGFVLMYIASKVNYQWYRWGSVLVLGLAFLLLVLVLVVVVLT